jgi:hypothetical protein
MQMSKKIIRLCRLKFEVSRTCVGPVLLAPVKQLARLPALFHCVPSCIMSNKCSGWFAASAIVSNI